MNLKFLSIDKFRESPAEHVTIDGADDAPYYGSLTGQRGRCARLWVSATAFGDWEHWKAAADRALNAYLLGSDGDCTTRRSEVLPLSASPAFVFGPERYGERPLWLNALLPDKAAFLMSLERAKTRQVIARVADRERRPIPDGWLLHGLPERDESPLTALFNDMIEQPAQEYEDPIGLLCLEMTKGG